MKTMLHGGITALLLLVYRGPVGWAAEVPPGEGFRFAPVREQSLGLWDGPLPVLVYNHGVIEGGPGVPADRARSSYVHPLYGVDGEVLTDDFPPDHFHHRGLFWSWPHVEIDGKHYDLWMLSGIRHRFERWIAREILPDQRGAVLAVENGWYVGDTRVLREEVRLVVHPLQGDARAIDLGFRWTPQDRAIRLTGAEGKSYGGLTLRYAPGTNTVITTPLGHSPEDLYMTPLPWADLSREFKVGAKGVPSVSGAAIFISPDHPDYPPTWLTRHYGVLCLGWPGVKGGNFAAGETFAAKYRVWVHRGPMGSGRLESEYAAYARSVTNATAAAAPAPAPSSASPAAPSAALPMRAVRAPDRIQVFAGDALFTEYLFGDDTKYPHFYPLNGPATGRSVTGMRLDPYPHHSSLFFGCDRVNDGNYWQEGLERGRIASRAIHLAREKGDTVEFEQDCVWERPGAEAPFDDHRRIVISAPGERRRVIDFTVALTARTDVRILKNNHSLFSARMAPDLSVTGGGRLFNADGAEGEAATFGKTSAWMDARGRRGDATEGLTIFPHPASPWTPSTWFTRDYGFFSPTPMYWLPGDELRLGKGTRWTFRYRVVVHGDAPTREALAAAFADWSAR